MNSVTTLMTSHIIEGGRQAVRVADGSIRSSDHELFHAPLNELKANAKRLEMQMAAEGRDSRRMRALRSFFQQVSMILDDSSTYLSFLIGGSSVIAETLSAGSLAAWCSGLNHGFCRVRVSLTCDSGCQRHGARV
jgi:hypothetical protein